MADIVTGTVSGQVDMTAVQAALSDVRREQAGLAATTVSASAQTATELSKQIDAIDDSLTLAIHTVSRESADNKAQITALGFQVRDGFFAAGKDAEIAGLKTQIDAAKNTTYLSDQITNDGEKTRLMMAAINTDDLNRRLIERNAAILEVRGEHRLYGLSNQINALHSQFQAASQKTVNFGTMGNNTPTSTNNVA